MKRDFSWIDPTKGGSAVACEKMLANYTFAEFVAARVVVIERFLDHRTMLSNRAARIRRAIRILS